MTRTLTSASGRWKARSTLSPGRQVAAAGARPRRAGSPRARRSAPPPARAPAPSPGRPAPAAACGDMPATLTRSRVVSGPGGQELRARALGRDDVAAGWRARSGATTGSRSRCRRSACRAAPPARRSGRRSGPARCARAAPSRPWSGVRSCGRVASAGLDLLQREPDLLGGPDERHPAQLDPRVAPLVARPSARSGSAPRPRRSAAPRSPPRCARRAGRWSASAAAGAAYA